MVGRVVEVLFTLILVYLVVTNASGFSRVISASGAVLNQSIRNLQGR